MSLGRLGKISGRDDRLDDYCGHCKSKAGYTVWCQDRSGHNNGCLSGQHRRIGSDMERNIGNMVGDGGKRVHRTLNLHIWFARSDR